MPLGVKLDALALGGKRLLSHTLRPHILRGTQGSESKSVVFDSSRCAAAAVLAAGNVFSSSKPHPFLNPDWSGLGKCVK